MIATNNKIIVSVNLAQKDIVVIGGVQFATANNFETNYREKSPVIATVVEGNEYVKSGDSIICHHNLFYQPSPYYLYDNLYSIPFGKTIFIKINSDGSLMPICGNMICEQLEVKSQFSISEVKKKPHINRYKVIDGGWTMYKKDDLVFTRPNAGYVIVYNIEGIEHRICKVDSDQICGVLKHI